ncbi:MAG: SpoIIE family protein phosphatase [Oscillospiraceae bacterium]|nr:SpoIIE family protein phosphatase [Oscillospiraceae bacterium]
MDMLKLPPTLRIGEKTAVLRGIGCFLAGVVLSGTRIAGVWLPAAVCLIAALPAGLFPLLTLIGTAIGCAAFWELETAILSVASGFLAMTAVWALRDTDAAESRYFAPLTATAAGAVASVLLLLSRPVTAQTAAALLVRIAALYGGTVCAKRVLKEPNGVPLCVAAAAVISGCGAIRLPGGIPLGGVAASFAAMLFAGSPLALPMAALGGLAMDWSRTAASAVPPLIAATLAASIPARKWQKPLLFLAAAAGILILSGSGDGALFLAMAAGALLSLPVRELPIAAQMVPSKQLGCAAAAMSELYRQMDADICAPEGIPTAELYDRAASKVCARCARCAICWREEGEKTRETLRAIAPAIRSRGEAAQTDFPAEFSASCRHFPDFLKALNEGLSIDAAIRRDAAGKRELLSVCRAQYRIFADLLRAISAPKPSVMPRFAADFACRGHGLRDVSGDRTASLEVGNRCYLLLCDGMGTGETAAEDSRKAIGLLSRLLLAGCEPDDALELLNGLWILRENGGSAAIDLAAIDLSGGEGVLYKWGGAPSYLLTEKGAKKIGTASLPPGIGVGGTHQPQQFRLSLGEGETLILVSDGIGGEDAARLLQEVDRESVRELAAGLLSCGSAPWEDDRTVAVLRLHPISTR